MPSSVSTRAPAVLAVTLLTFGAVLAGCIFPFGGSDDLAPAGLPQLSAVQFEALPGESVWIPSSADGTLLHAVLYLPDTSSRPDWRAPVILIMSPYNGHDARDDPLDPTSKPLNHQYRWLIDHFVPRGYALVHADIRGTGDSGGCLEQTAKLQAQDGYDAVEWLAQQAWSNGKVGMYGKSYRAEAMQATAVLQPPHLATIVPVASVSGQYEYGFYDGVPYTLQTLQSNLFYLATDGAQPPTTMEGLKQYPTRVGCHPEMLARGLDFSGDWNEFWEAREIRKGADKVTTSVLYVHGLQDWNVKPVAIRDWYDRLPGDKRAILGQWAHDFPEWNTLKEEWSRPDWRETVHKWYDYWLLGIENGILQELPPVQVQDDAGVWRREQTFPPTDALPFTLHLAPDRLQHDAPAEAFELGLRENEEAFLSANAGVALPEADTPDLATLLAFESEALARDLHVSGWPTLALNFTLTDSLTRRKENLDPHFAVILYDVAPDGSERWVNRAYLSARHRDGIENPQPTPFGEPITYHLRFFPADSVIPAGHKVRVTLAGSDAWTQPEGSLWAGVVTGGALTLPAIERDWNAVTLPVKLGPPVEQ